MSGSSAADPLAIPLTGPDCMLRAFDREASRFHRASHASQLVLRLGAGLDVDLLRKTIEDVANACPIVRARIRRRSGIGEPVYDWSRPGPIPLVRIHSAERGSDDGVESAPIFAAAMNEPFAGSAGELLRLDVLQYSDGSSDLALTWLHMLLDGSGSELFVKALAEVAAGQRAADDLDAGDTGALEGTLRERGDKAREWQNFLSRFADYPPLSLHGKLHRGPQRMRYRVTSFDDEQTKAIAALAAEKAGFMTPVMYYMAAAIRAHHRLMVERKTIPASYVLPLPVNIRPKGQEGAVFRTHVSMIWFQVLPNEVEDFDVLLESLKVQRRDAIRAGLVDSGRYAIDFARYVPADLFGRMVRRTLGGELCSFFFAFTGDFLAGVDEFMGAPVRDGFHVPAVLPSPGSCAAMSIHRGRLNLTHVYQAGAVSDDEVVLFSQTMRSELCAGLARENEAVSG